MKMKDVTSFPVVIPNHLPVDKIDSDGHNMGLEHFLKTYFNTAHNLLLCPFHISSKNLICPQQRYTLIKSNWLQKLLSGFLFILNFFWILSEIRKYIPHETDNPRFYFSMVHGLVDTALKVVTFKQFWWNQQEILGMINLASGCERSDGPNTKHISTILATLTVIISFYFWILGPGATLPWSLATWWGSLMRRGRFNFFLEKQFIDTWAVDAIIGCLTSVAYLHRKVFGMFTDFLIIMAVLTAHQATRNFIEKLQPDEITWEYVQGEYEKLKRLFESINSFLGKNMACRLVVISLTWAFSYDIYFRNGTDGFSRIFYFLYHAGSIIVLLACADICQQVN